MENKNKKHMGVMVSEIPFANLPVLFKNAGLDYFILDCEHGGFNYSDVSAILMTAKLCNIISIIRLPDNSRKDITKFMDMGAIGLLLPMTNTADDIKQVVKYAKYANLGKRGLSTMRAHTLYNPPEILAYMEQANFETKIFAQIETAKGVDNVESILSVAGADGCFIGPNDLSCDYACLDNIQAPKITQVIEKTAKYAANLNKFSGIITSNKHYLDSAAKFGFEFYCIGSELSILKSGAEKVKNFFNF